MGHILLDRLHFYLKDCHRSKSAQRDLVYLAIHKLAPCTKAEIRQELANSDIHTASIYRLIEFLLDVRAIKSSGDKFEISPRLASHHGHNLVCECCGQKIVFNRLSLENQFERIALKNGYSLTDHTFELIGSCAQCQIGS